jgi:hypothetical protein
MSGHDDAPAGGGQRRDEVAVEEPPGRVAVEQDDRTAGALVDVVHAPAVDPREARSVRPLRLQLGGQDQSGLDVTL